MYPISPSIETVAACLTPPGQAAVAVLGVDGPGAWEAVRPLFRTRSGAELPAAPQPGRFLLGRLGETVSDEVVLTIKRGGPSPQLELHCHGGRANVRFLLDLLAARGLHVCDWREFLRRTEPDPLRAAAAIALAEAPTVRTAAILLDQYQGAFAAALDAVIAALDRGDVGAASAVLDQLARYAPLGRRLTAPWRVVVAGPPNVGKSSLVNALAGYQRSIVAPTPGTTRDVVTTRLAVDGWPIELADTAGVREATDALEMQGVQKAREATADADLRLWVLDASAPPIWTEGNAAVQRIVNKIDLPAAWNLDEAPGAVRVSARAGEGLPELCAAISCWLVPDPPPAGAAVPFTAALGEGVLVAQRLLQSGQLAQLRLKVEALRRSDLS
ncbi:MAG TPA: GTPase [Gemmataceae bacterium]|nr:GTPase [Gemmataceae bacterium]